jgi:hypothetical protein
MATRLKRRLELERRHHERVTTSVGQGANSCTPEACQKVAPGRRRRPGVRVQKTIRTPKGCQSESDARFPLAPLQGADRSALRFRGSPSATPGYLLASLRDAVTPMETP